MSSERTFYLVILGNGSFGIGFRHWRAGVHEIDAATAEEVLAWKEQYPGASWLAVTDEYPDVKLPPKKEQRASPADVEGVA